MSAQPAKRRVFIVGGSPLCRHGMSQIVNSQADLVTCGEADVGDQTGAAAKATKPDLMILDLGEAKTAPSAALIHLREMLPQVPLLAIVPQYDPAETLSVLRAGANGCFSRTEGFNEFLLAIRKTVSGEKYLSTSVSMGVIDRLVSGKELSITPSLERLTQREREVLKLIGRRLPLREIAGALGIRPKTAETHRLRIREKLGLPDSKSLVEFASVLGGER